MKVTNRLCFQQLLDVVVTTRRHVDILAVPGLLLVNSFLKKKLNRTTEVLLARSILLGGYNHQIDWPHKVVMDNLFPNCFVLALENIFKLHEGVNPIKMNFLAPL